MAETHYELAGLELETPLINAAGTAKTPEELERLAPTRLGAFTLGTITREPLAGAVTDADPAYYHNPETGETYNWKGFPNAGMAEFERMLPEMAELAGHRPLIVSVAGLSDKPGPELADLAYRAFSAGADIVEVNPSCPNVEGQVLCYRPDDFGQVLQQVEAAVGADQPLAVKLPALNNGLITQIASVVEATSGVKVAVTMNTIPVDNPTDSFGRRLTSHAGLSGPVTRGQARWQLSNWRAKLPETVDVVSTSGVFNGLEAADRVHTLGAAAVEIATALLESQDHRRTVDRLLEEYDRACEVARV